MIISVITPVHGQTGNTTVALTLVHALALTQMKEVCLTHIDYGSQSIISSLGVEPSEDITRSLSHVAKMLTNNALKADEIPDYAIKIFKGLDIYSTHKVDLEEYEILSFFDNLIRNMTAYHHTIIDVDSEKTSNSTVKALEVSDAIIIPITQNTIVIQEAIRLKRMIREKLEDIKGKKKSNAVAIYFVVNHYRPEIMSSAKIAKKLGVPRKSVLTLEYNQWFMRSSNNGRLTDIFSSCLNNDARVLKLKFDMKRMCKTLLGKEFIWEVDNKKVKQDDLEDEGVI